MRRFAIVLSLAALLTLAACEQRAPSVSGAGNGNVAVLDLDRIVQAMGWNEALNARGRERVNELANELREGIRRQLDEVAQRYGPMPSPEQAAQLQGFSQQAQMLMQQAPAQAQVQVRHELEADLIRQVTPSAQAAAASRGYGIVMFRQPGSTGFMVVDPGVDITDAVIAELKRTGVSFGGAATGPLDAGSPGSAPEGAPPGAGNLPFPINPTTRPATQPSAQPS